MTKNMKIDTIADMSAVISDFLIRLASPSGALLEVRDVAGLRTQLLTLCPTWPLSEATTKRLVAIISERVQIPPGFPIANLLVNVNPEFRAFIRSHGRFAAGLYGLEGKDAPKFAVRVAQEALKTKRKLGAKPNLLVLDAMRESLRAEAQNLDVSCSLTAEDYLDFEWLWLGVEAKSRTDALVKDIAKFILSFVFKKDTMEDLAVESRLLKGGFAAYFRQRLELSVAGPAEMKKTVFSDMQRLLNFLTHNISCPEQTFAEVGLALRFCVEHRKFAGTLTYPRTLMRAVYDALRYPNGRKHAEVAAPIHDLVAFHFLGEPLFGEASLVASRKTLTDKAILQPETPTFSTNREAKIKLLRELEHAIACWTKLHPNGPSPAEVAAVMTKAGELVKFEDPSHIDNLIRLALPRDFAGKNTDELAMLLCGDREFLPDVVASFAACQSTPPPEVNEDINGLLGTSGELNATFGLLTEVASEFREEVRRTLPWRVAVEWRNRITRILKQASVVVTAAAELADFIAAHLDNNNVLAKYLVSGISGGGKAVEKLRADLIKAGLFCDDNAASSPPPPGLDLPFQLNEVPIINTTNSSEDHPLEELPVTRYGLVVAADRVADLEILLTCKISEMKAAHKAGNLTQRLERIVVELKNKLEDLDVTVTAEFRKEFSSILETAQDFEASVAHNVSAFVAGRIRGDSTLEKHGWASLTVASFLKPRAAAWVGAAAPWPLANARELAGDFRAYVATRQVAVFGLEAAVREAFPEGPAELLSSLLFAVVEESRVEAVFEAMKESGLFKEENFDFDAWKKDVLWTIPIDQLAKPAISEHIIASLPELVRAQVSPTVAGASPRGRLVDTLAYLEDKYAKADDSWGSSPLCRNLKVVVDGMKCPRDKRIAKVALLWHCSNFAEFMERVAKLSS